MATPHEPDVDGIEKTAHDGMSDEGHEEQFKHADSGTSMHTDEEDED